MASMPLIVLSLDGGGVRSLSSLLILNEIIKRLIDEERRSLQVHNIFNLVCGTSGGGLCAMMLARLGFDIPECVAHLSNVSNMVFAGGPRTGTKLSKGFVINKYSATKLETAIRHIRGTADELQRQDPPQCYVVCRETDWLGYVLSDFKADCLASFPNNQPACRVWQAGRATSAAQTFFRSMRIEDRYFTDGGILYNNPILTTPEQLPLAGLDRFTDQQCYVSIGTGKANPADLEAARNQWRPTRIFHPIDNLLMAATTAEKDAVAFDQSCEWRHDDTAGRICRHFRFNCDNGLASFELDQADRLPDIIRLTQDYLNTVPVQNKIMECVRVLAGMMP